MPPIPAFVGRLRYAASIALGRHLWRAPRNTEELEGACCVIHRFSAFQGHARIVGQVGSRVQAAELRLPGGSSYPIPITSRRFDATLAIPASSSEIARGSLVLRLEGGISRVVTDLGPQKDDPAHQLLPRFLGMLAEQGGGHLLEVGSRARSGITRRDQVPIGWQYTGMDVLPGPNVDVVGDAHKLSQVFPHQRFDAMMAFSVIEHILMPWKFAIELNRVLNTGALGILTTHQAWPVHDAPWDFWRFSNTSWAALFNEATGFEVVSAALGERMYLVPEHLHPVSAFTDTSLHAGWGMSVVIFRKTAETTLEWPVDPDAIVRTSYPA